MFHPGGERRGESIFWIPRRQTEIKGLYEVRFGNEAGRSESSVLDSARLGFK